MASTSSRVISRRRPNSVSRETASSSRSVAVHQQRQDFAPVLGVPANSLSGARLSFDYWIDSFQVARIRREPDLDLRTGGKFTYRVITEMIFHVAIASDQLGNVFFAKLSKDDLERFAQEICQDIESAAMRHAHANFFDASSRTLMQNRVQNRHE